MIHQDYQWHKVAENPAAILFSKEGLATVEAGGRKICIALFRDRLYSFPANCPHAGGDLSSGYIDPTGNIVCPLHYYKFSLQSGRNISGEGYDLKLFLIEIRPDGVFVGLRKNNIELK